MRRHRFTHSLSGRLVLVFVVTGVVLLVLMGATIGRAFHASMDQMLRPHLVQYLDYLQADIGQPPDYARAEELSRRLSLTVEITGPDGTWNSDGLPADLAALSIIHTIEKDGREYAYGRIGQREYVRVRDGDYTYAYGLVRITTTTAVLPLVVLLVVLALLYHAIRRLLAPVRVIKGGVERIGRGELDHRIDVGGSDDLSELARSINTMADDVQQMLDSKRQLLLAISHELRSPLTRAKVATSLVDDTGQRGEIERELNGLEKLIEELLETERLATRHEVLHKQCVNLTAIACEVTENLRDGRKPDLIAPSEPVEAEADPVRIKLLLRNLLENALRHTPPGAAVPELCIDFATDDVIALTVTDHGPGIAAEHLPHVTEAFYRVDPARRRETGGYGLGLYLCRRIAEVHGGDLVVTSEPPNGTQVRVLLPRKGTPAPPA